ncbi:MAG: hypothetical protein ACYTBV_17680 [Planctomycetota bacterium]
MGHRGHRGHRETAAFAFSTKPAFEASLCDGFGSNALARRANMFEMNAALCGRWLVDGGRDFLPQSTPRAQRRSVGLAYSTQAARKAGFVAASWLRPRGSCPIGEADWPAFPPGGRRVNGG